MNKQELNSVLKDHAKWLANDPNGNRANLERANLTGANLRSANLERANLMDANLERANLERANLTGANLEHAYLMGANLTGANLERANLMGANLTGADLESADLGGANLERAYIRSVNLTGANLERANLMGANLEHVYLTGAYLRSANLEGATLPDYQICPQGPFIAYKKAALPDGEHAIVALEILGKRTSSPIGRKCRCDSAKVLSIRKVDGTDVQVAYSHYDSEFRYTVGEVVSEPAYSDDIRTECAPGIHFFVTEREAERYGF